MDSTGERFIPQCMGGQISAEHFSRYLFVCNYIDLAGKSVLDIASGSGYGSFLLAKRAKEVTGVDVSQEAVNYASEQYALPNLAFLQGDCRKIPKPDHSVDVLVSFETIEHMEAQDEFFAEIKRVLNPQGILVMSSPNKRLYTDLPNRINPYHVKELYNEEFLSLVSSHFQFVEYFGQNYQLSSAIYHIDGCHKPTERTVDFIEEGTVEKEPLYNIVVASNTELSCFHPLPFTLFYETEHVDELCKAAYEAGMADCHGTTTWKVGRFLVAPALYLRALFSKKRN